jgi:hypothetical protein
MKVNIKKVDERIQKLQEIKRIAADPELVAMLLEFVASDDDRTETAPPATGKANSGAKTDDMELVNQVMRGIVPPNSSPSSGRRP